MSSVTTDFSAPAVARQRALRVADGIIAGYINSLTQATRSAAGESSKPKLSRLAARTYQCGASRSNGLAARRRPQLLRAPAAA